MMLVYIAITLNFLGRSLTIFEASSNIVEWLSWHFHPRYLVEFVVSLERSLMHMAWQGLRPRSTNAAHHPRLGIGCANS